MRLKELFELRNGYTPSKNNTEFWEGGTIPWFRMEDIRKNGRILSDSIQHITPEAIKSAGLFEANSFIVATTATIGEHAWLIADSLANQRFTNLKIRKSLIDSVALKYIFFLLFYVDDECKKNTRTTTFPAVNMNDFKNIELHLPPLGEQEAIAEYLDKECEKIGREIELLERKANAYRRLRRSIINRAVTRGLNPNAPLKPSGNNWIGEIPAHWGIERNKNLLFEHKETVGEDKSYQLLSLTLNGVIIRDMDAGGKFPAEFNTYKKVNPDNLIFCLFDMDETPRTIGLSSHKGMITGAYDVFDVNQELVISEWVYYFYFAIDQIKGLKPFYTGLRKVVKTQNFANIHIPLPPKVEQQEIAAYLDEKCGKIDAIIEKIATKVERLKELKRSLINEVVTGRRAI